MRPPGAGPATLPEEFLGLIRRSITPRERQVLELMCEGLGNGEIAGACGISATTLKQHQLSLYRKVGTGNRSQLIVQALRLRLVVPSWLAGPLPPR